MPVTREQCVDALNRIETRLIEVVPEIVRSLGIREPAYCVFLLYEDGTSDEVTPTLLVGLKSLLDACNNEVVDGIGDRSSQDKAWYPHQSISSPFPGFPCPQTQLDAIAEDTLIAYKYEIFEPDDIRDDPVLYREMMCRVAQSLNQINWADATPVTSDFFVMVTDYSTQNLFEDLPHCVSQSKLQRLREAYDSIARLDLA